MRSNTVPRMTKAENRTTYGTTGGTISHLRVRTHSQAMERAAQEGVLGQCGYRRHGVNAWDGNHSNHIIT